MNRDEQEMTLWCALYTHSWEEGWSPADKAADSADHAVEEFRKRYPLSPPLAQRPATWCDEPPFGDRNATHYAWVQGKESPCLIEHGAGQWIYKEIGCASSWSLLSGRRVSPIAAKPPEPKP
jgi:hypothetical protein